MIILGGGWRGEADEPGIYNVSVAGINEEEAKILFEAKGYKMKRMMVYEDRLEITIDSRGVDKMLDMQTIDVLTFMSPDPDNNVPLAIYQLGKIAFEEKRKAKGEMLGKFVKRIDF